MRFNLFCFIFTFTICTHDVQAQTFSGIEYVDIANVKAAVGLHGDFNWDPATITSACEFPKGGGVHLSSTTSVWMSGYDAGNRLHVSAQTYRQSGNDYWPGPLDNTGVLTMAEATKWAKIWKVSFFDINNHLANTTHTVSNTPSDVLEWPAKGNPNAKGNSGTPLTIATDMAPFIDVNNDGKYNALDGDYPEMKGDQMLWWVFSDNGPTHDNHAAGNASVPFAAEVHCKAYAYKRNTLIDNVVYYEMDIINKSGDDYMDFRLGINADLDLGYYNDDYLGFDSARRLGFVYNGTAIDGNGQVPAYGNKPPVAGYTFLKMPGDIGTTLKPTGSFMYFNNDLTIIGNPQVDSQFSNYMRSKMRNGAHLRNDFVGNGTNAMGLGNGPNVDYAYPGDPTDTAGWSECVCNNPVGDRRFVLSTGDFTFNKNSTVSIAFALVVEDGDSSNACPYSDVSGVKDVSDTAWKNYHTPPKSYVSVEAISSGKALGIYPNPATDIVRITAPFNLNVSGAGLKVYDAIGRTVNVSYSAAGSDISMNVEQLPPGIYNIVYRNGAVQQSGRFVKE